MNLSFREQKKLKIFLLVLILFMFLPILLTFFVGKYFTATRRILQHEGFI